MIDTDKYEGHTGSCKNNCNGCYDDMEKLLAEVKRLREVNEKLQWYYEKCIELGCVAGVHEHWGIHNGLVVCEDCGHWDEEEVKDLQKKLDNLREYCHIEGYDIFNWEVKNIEVIE